MTAVYALTVDLYVRCVILAEKRPVHYLFLISPWEHCTKQLSKTGQCPQCLSWLKAHGK